MRHLFRVQLGIALIALLLGGCRAPFVTTSLRTIDGAAVVGEVVLPTRSCGDYFIVDAMIDGRGPFPMLLDTGAGTTVLSPDLARAADISSRISSIVIDRFRATGSMSCVIMPIDHLRRALGVDIEGILAYNIFEGVLLTYDYPGEEIRVREGVFSEEELAHPGVVPTSKGTRPFIRAAIDDVEFTVLLDTGSGAGFSLRDPGRFPLEEALRPTSAQMRINGLFVVESGRLAGDVQLGPLTLRAPIVDTARTVSLTGQDVLRNFVLTFDQVEHRVRFDRPAADLEAPIEFAPLHGLGMAVAPRDDRLIVRLVFEDTPAEAAGLLKDDEIISIDGLMLGERGCRHLERKSTNGPRPTELVVERNGERIQIAVTVDVLVP